MNALTRNDKLAKASVRTWGWSIFPGLTCPQAGDCKAICYACKGYYQVFWDDGVSAAWMAKTELSADTDAFIDALTKAIAGKVRRGCKAIRIHTEGDFYSARYLAAWLVIMSRFPGVRFYAYTKSVSLLKAANLPNNFTVIFSFGGKEDHLIDPKLDRHAIVFDSPEALRKARYINAMEDDTLAWESRSKRIGLVRH